jgi:hypothetical protein
VPRARRIEEARYWLEVEKSGTLPRLTSVNNRSVPQFFACPHTVLRPIPATVPANTPSIASISSAESRRCVVRAARDPFLVAGVFTVARLCIVAKVSDPGIALAITRIRTCGNPSGAPPCGRLKHNHWPIFP